MAGVNDVLISVLYDVVVEGVAVIDKRKLLSLMRKSHDRPTAWAALLDHWEEIGQDRDELHGVDQWGTIVLFKGRDITTKKVKTWANE